MRFPSSVLTVGLLLASGGVVLAQPATQFNVKSFGAAGDGVRPDTEAINKTIQAAHDAGGGTVLVPAGNYVSGTIHLLDNVTFWIDAGATILGTKNLADYRWPEGGREWDGAIILANGVHNVALMGRGTINGQNLNNPRGEERIRGPHAILGGGDGREGRIQVETALLDLERELPIEVRAPCRQRPGVRGGFGLLGAAAAAIPQ